MVCTEWRPIQQKNFVIPTKFVFANMQSSLPTSANADFLQQNITLPSAVEKDHDPDSPRLNDAADDLVTPLAQNPAPSDDDPLLAAVLDTLTTYCSK